MEPKLDPARDAIATRALLNAKVDKLTQHLIELKKSQKQLDFLVRTLTLIAAGAWAAHTFDWL